MPRHRLWEVGECPTPRKNRYADEAIAREKLQDHDPEMRARLKPYLCQCGKWHLSSIDLFLLREDRGSRYWSVARSVNGDVVLSVGGPRRKRIAVELSSEDLHQLADALKEAASA